MVRKTSPRVADSPGCLPLLAMYKQAVLEQPSRWTRVEEPFLRAMWDFDQNFALGIANQGDNQNGKGDFFTDLIGLLLENCSGKELHGRGAVPGLIFPNHALDTSYPEEGVVEILIETKAAGAPKSLRNPKQKNPKGRSGSADLDKRIKEAGLKTIDLKAEWARSAGQGGGPAGDLLSWLRRSKPLSFLFLGIRVLDERDLERTLFFANAANRMMDDVGLVAYEPNAAGDGYRACKIPSHLELDRVLARVCTALRSLP
ncbi:MAG TPA: hypothetical protein VF121_13785 [Thermoanaerobaculia bacterium]|nr:hypothetical protein [Thermoanaerobaculia bacterium]